jgi:hypothetical protein
MANKRYSEGAKANTTRERRKFITQYVRANPFVPPVIPIPEPGRDVPFWLKLPVEHPLHLETFDVDGTEKIALRWLLGLLCDHEKDRSEVPGGSTTLALPRMTRVAKEYVVSMNTWNDHDMKISKFML